MKQCYPQEQNLCVRLPNIPSLSSSGWCARAQRAMITCTLDAATMSRPPAHCATRSRYILKVLKALILSSPLRRVAKSALCRIFHDGATGGMLDFGLPLRCGMGLKGPGWSVLVGR